MDNLYQVKKNGEKGDWLISEQQGVKFDYFLIFMNMLLFIATGSSIFIMFTAFMGIRAHARILNTRTDAKGTKFPIKEFKLKREGIGKFMLMIAVASAVSFTTEMTNQIFTPSNLFQEGATFLNSAIPSMTVSIETLPPIAAAGVIFILASQEEQVWRGTVPYLFSEETRSIGYILSILGFSIFHLAMYTQNPFTANFNFFSAAIVGFVFIQVTEYFDSTAPSTLGHTILNLNEQTLQVIRMMVT